MVVAGIATLPDPAAAAGKKTLTPDAFGLWKTIASPALSPNGAWAAYTLSSISGTCELVVRSTRTSTELRIPRIERAAAVAATDADWTSRSCAALRTEFTADSRHVVFAFDSRPEGPESGAGTTGSAAIGIVNLADGAVSRIEHASSFVLPRESGRYLAYRVDGIRAAPNAKSATGAANAGRPAAQNSPQAQDPSPAQNSARPQRSAQARDSARAPSPAQDSRPAGTEGKARSGGRRLVIREIASGAETPIDDVTEFAFDDTATYLAYVVMSAEPASRGVYARRVADGHVSALAAGAVSYRGLVLDQSTRQIAFLADTRAAEESRSRYALWYSRSPQSQAEMVVGSDLLKTGMLLAVDAGVQFSRAGNAIIFSTTPVAIADSAPSETQSATNVAATDENEVAHFELWSWKEPEPMPYGRRTTIPRYTAVYFIRDKRWTQLGGAAIPEVLLSDDAHRAVGIDATPYRKPWDVGDPGRRARRAVDVYGIDPLSGKALLIRRGLLAPLLNGGARVALSPGGRYLMYFENRTWFSYDLGKGTLANLTGTLAPAIRFDIDPATPPGVELQDWLPEGVRVAGWTTGDSRVLLYGRRDLWEFDPSGNAAPRNVTAGIGQRENIVFRRWEHYAESALFRDDRASTTAVAAALAPATTAWTASAPTAPASTAANRKPLPANGLLAAAQPESAVSPDPVVDPGQPLLLVALDLDTMASGLWEAGLGASSKPKRLMMADKRITLLSQARHASQYLLTQQTFSEFPDLWTGPRLDHLTRISNVNPQQAEYRWGAAELIDFQSASGSPLKARLYRPDDFDASRKYPVLVSLDEQQSYLLHLYQPPAPRSSAWSGLEGGAPALVSRGYLQLMPDIRSESPTPVQSAVAAVRGAVQAVVDRGSADRSRICLSGHSFGAYETAALITQTDVFRCAIMSAGVVNIISAYGTMPAGVIYYEEGQGRLGATPWEKLFDYIANSPVFRLDRVVTPVLAMYNDADDVIPFTQGLELFRGLRRNSKRAYMLNYRGEGHELRGYANRLDWDARSNEFLDYYLRGDPAHEPEWMRGPESDQATRDQLTQAAEMSPQSE
jgi:dipeptidyl aminopeptidase/acylaminoacyl peptidase